MEGLNKQNVPTSYLTVWVEKAPTFAQFYSLSSSWRTLRSREPRSGQRRVSNSRLLGGQWGPHRRPGREPPVSTVLARAWRRQRVGLPG